MITVDQLIKMFNFNRLHTIENALFFETYHAPETIAREHLPDRYQSDKPFSTAILYLLTADANAFNALHKLPTDEIYHFYLGDPVELLQLHPGGASERIILGHDLLGGQKVQHVVPRDIWQGSHLLPGGQFALLGTTMAPGYAEGDYVAGDREQLIAAYPARKTLITQLTRCSEAGK